MWTNQTAIGVVIALALVTLYLLTCIRVLNEYERGAEVRVEAADFARAEAILRQHRDHFEEAALDENP